MKFSFQLPLGRIGRTITMASILIREVTNGKRKIFSLPNPGPLSPIIPVSPNSELTETTAYHSFRLICANNLPFPKSTERTDSRYAPPFPQTDSLALCPTQFTRDYWYAGARTTPLFPIAPSRWSPMFILVIKILGSDEVWTQLIY